MAKILFYPICVIVSLIVLANTFSVALQESNPEAAIWLNPLNVDARVNLVTEKLRIKTFATDSQLSEVLIKGRKISPLDARLISLEGIYNDKKSEFQKAQKLFSTSLAILPTEYNALVYKFRYHFKNNQYVEALDIIDIVSRRWIKRQNTFVNFIPTIALDPAGFDHASKLFNASKNLRYLLISALVKNPATLKLAVKLVQNWDTEAESDYWRLANSITRKLLRNKKYDEANLAFRSFLNDTQLENYKYIYNGDFSNQPLNNNFDWNIKKQVGVSHTIKQKRFDESNNKLQSYLEIRFLGKPIQYKNVTQTIKLTPEKYVLKINYSTEKLKTAKPIMVSLKCYDSSIKLATYIFDPKNSGSMNSSTPFTVPVEKCKMAHIIFHTDFLAKSWRNRFSGVLNIKNISIERVES